MGNKVPLHYLKASFKKIKTDSTTDEIFKLMSIWIHVEVRMKSELKDNSLFSPALDDMAHGSTRVIF